MTRLRLSSLILILLLASLPQRSAHAQDNLVALAVRSVVRIRPQRCDVSGCVDSGTTGSGAIIDPSGIILTAAHVTVHVPSEDPLTPPTFADEFVIEMVEDVRSIPVATYRARLLATKLKSDLALLRIYAKVDGSELTGPLELPTIPISDRKVDFEPLRLMGFPPAGGDSITIVPSNPSGFDRDAGGDLIKIQAQLSRGTSGGPVLVERNRRLEVVGVVIKARGDSLEVGLSRDISALNQLDWVDGALHVWPENIQVGTFGDGSNQKLYFSMTIHMLDFKDRKGELLAFAFDAQTKQRYIGPKTQSTTSSGQFAVKREFSSTKFSDRIETLILSVPTEQFGTAVDNLVFRLVLYDAESRMKLWEDGVWYEAKPLLEPPRLVPTATPTPAPSESDQRVTPKSDANATATELARIVRETVEAQMAAASTATPTPSATPSPTSTSDANLAATEQAARIQTAVAIALESLPTPTPTLTPTPDFAATETKQAEIIQEAVKATLNAQPTATPNRTATEAAIANAAATAIQMTIEARATATRSNTPTPTPIQLLNSSGSGGNSLPLRIAYTYGEVSKSDLRVADVESGDVINIASQSCDEAEPAWSPDGRFVAYHANCASNYEIYRVSGNGGSASRLTSTSSIDEREPDYSPDGSLIIYRVNLQNEVKTNNVGEMWVMNSDGTDPRSLGIVGRAPAWSSDGTKIAFMSDQSGLWNIYVYDFNSNRTTQLTNCSTNCRWPAWSPDSSTIIFNTTTRASNTTADSLWTIPARGGQMRQFASGGNIGRPSWSRTGLIAFTSSDGIEYMDENGNGRTLLIPSDQNWAPHWSK